MRDIPVTSPRLATIITKRRGITRRSPTRDLPAAVGEAEPGRASDQRRLAGATLRVRTTKATTVPGGMVSERLSATRLRFGIYKECRFATRAPPVPRYGGR